MTVLLVGFWGSLALLLWVYFGYPVAAAVAGWLRPFNARADGPIPKLVTVGIATYDEAPQLEARIADILAQDVPFDLEIIVASDGSSDDTIEVADRLAANEPRLRVLDLPRSGQTGAQNEIFAAARGEVVVLSDAETRFDAGCLAALVAPFADARVGCTTGRLEWRDSSATATARNEGAYWRYEQVVRGLESRAGWLTAVTGALLAVRATAYREVPIHASMDHLLPLYVREQGLRVLAVPSATASDREIAGLGVQFRNRSRTATRGIRSNLSMAGRLAPWRQPSASLAIWSHKLLRWATPILAIVSGLTALGLGLLADPRYLVVVAIGTIALLVAGAGWMVRAAGRRPPRITSFPLAIVIVNLAFLNGWWNVVRGRRIEAWRRTDWAARTVDEGNDIA